MIMSHAISAFTINAKRKVNQENLARIAAMSEASAIIAAEMTAPAITPARVLSNKRTAPVVAI